MKRELALLLAVVAQAGHDDADSARRAYLAGMRRAAQRAHCLCAAGDGVLAWTKPGMR